MVLFRQQNHDCLVVLNMGGQEFGPPPGALYCAGILLIFSGGLEYHILAVYHITSYHIRSICSTGPLKLFSNQFVSLM